MLPSQIILHSFSGMEATYDFAGPIPKGYEWAEAALTKLKSDLSDVELMCPDLLNAFIKNPESHGYIQLTESAFSPRVGALTTIAHAFGIRRGAEHKRIGIEIFHEPYLLDKKGAGVGNIVGHELAHVGDHVRGYGFNGDGSPTNIPLGLHSNSRMFALCTLADKVLEGPSNLITKLEKRIANAGYEPDKYKRELFAAALEHYIEQPMSVPSCTATYIEKVFLPDMKWKASGHHARRGKLDLDYLNPKHANISDQELEPILDAWLLEKPLTKTQEEYLHRHNSQAYAAVIDLVEGIIPALEKLNQYRDPASGGPLPRQRQTGLQ